MQGFISIPFKAESGISYANGVAKFSPAGVVLEFESKLFGLISNGVKEVRVGINDIYDIRFRKGFLKRGSRIEIRLNSFALLASLPNKDGKIVLKIAPQDVSRASEAIDRLKQDIAHEASLPIEPPQVSVKEILDNSESETERLHSPPEK